MSNNSGAHLTTSRINRLFRSLRAKCIALANHSNPSSQLRHTASVTYKNSSSRRSPIDDSTPPLALLPPPDSLETRIYLDRRMVDAFQLSKRIYEVRDAFRNILQVAFGQPNPTHSSRVPSLAEMCAKVIGRAIHEEVLVFEEEQAEADPSADDDHTRITDPLFEAVPAHRRSHAIASYALALVLHTCPHNPTLLSTALDLCLAYRLQHEARAVLHAFLELAIRPHPTAGHSCALAHPASSEFLVDLRAACAVQHPTMDNHTFVSILLDVLDESPREHREAWASKAVARLARGLRSSDSCGAYVALCSGLARHITISDSSKPQSKKRKCREVDEEQDSRLQGRLARWVKHILAHLYSHTQGPSSGQGDLKGEFRNILDFLLHVKPFALHVHQDGTTPAGSALASSLASLATYCLASPMVNNSHPEDIAALRSILQAARLVSETYEPLASIIFASPSQSLSDPDGSPTTPADTPTPPPSSPHAPPMQVLTSLTTSLRARALPHAEAALWSSALRHLDTLSLTMPRTAPAAHDTDALRACIAEEVDAAEARCFSRPRRRSESLKAQRRGPARAQEREQEQEGEDDEWEWEEMVGTWVRKRPAQQQHRLAKRRRVLQSEAEVIGDVEAGRVLRSHARKSEPAPRRVQRCSSQTNMAGALGRRAGLGAPRARSPESPLKSRVPSVRSRTPDEDGGRTEGEQEEEANAALHAQYRVFNFTSLLADAQTNCTVLHPHRGARHSFPGSFAHARQRTEAGPDGNVDAEEPQHTSCSARLPPRPKSRLRYGARRGWTCAQELSSEDALNLFALSSPAVAR